MQVLATAEKVAHALEERQRKRDGKKAAEPAVDPALEQLHAQLMERKLSLGRR